MDTHRVVVEAHLLAHTHNEAPRLPVADRLHLETLTQTQDHKADHHREIRMGDRCHHVGEGEHRQDVEVVHHRDGIQDEVHHRLAEREDHLQEVRPAHMTRDEAHHLDAEDEVAHRLPACVEDLRQVLMDGRQAGLVSDPDQGDRTADREQTHAEELVVLLLVTLNPQDHQAVIYLHGPIRHRADDQATVIPRSLPSTDSSLPIAQVFLLAVQVVRAPNLFLYVLVRLTALVPMAP